MSSKPTINLIDEWFLVAVHSIENANQDSDSQEVIEHEMGVYVVRIQIRAVILN